MYLSRVEIATLNRQKIKDLTHLGAYHNWVESSFPNEISKGERLRHLWRIDYLYGKNYLLLLSSEKPNVSNFGRYGIEETVQIKEYDNFLNKLSERQTVRFKLTANPVYRAFEPGKKNGKVFPHVTVEQQKNWLLKKSEKSGFELNENDFDIVNRDFPVLYKKGHRQVKLSRVTFEGFLKITDVSKFRETLRKGLGREKAYGMGLMTVIPLN